MMRTCFAVVVVCAWAVVAARSATAQSVPAITVTVVSGAPRDPVNVRRVIFRQDDEPQLVNIVVQGTGFVPGETVYLELVPPFPRATPALTTGQSGTVRLRDITVAADGTFAEMFTIDLPRNLAPGETGYYLVQAYPSSFGDRALDTVGRAPKAAFPVVGAAALPRTGTGTGADRPARRGQMLLLAALIVGLAVMRARTRHGS